MALHTGITKLTTCFILAFLLATFTTPLTFRILPLPLLQYYMTVISGITPLTFLTIVSALTTVTGNATLSYTVTGI